MKINPLEWSLVRGKEIAVNSGIVQLRAVAPFGVAVVVDGVETAVGVADFHRISLKAAAELVIEAPEGLNVFVKDRPARVVRMTGQKFTNIDRLPHQSGSMDAVSQAVRLMKIEELAKVRRIREERDLALAVIAAAKAKAEAEPKPNGKAKPKAEAAPKADAQPESDGEGGDP